MTLMAFQLLDVGRSSWFTSDVSVELRQDIIRAFASMEKDLRKTRPSQINLGVGSTSNSLTFKIPADVDGNGTVLNSSGALEWSSNITYSLNSAHRIVRTSTASTKILAHNIAVLEFTRPVSPLNLLQIDITAEKRSPSGEQLQDTGQIIIKMRN